MTEAEWLGSTEPKPMLVCLRGKASDRKLRLFACACLRHLWNLLLDGRSRQCVQVAERFADGQVTAQALRKAQERAWQVFSRAFEKQWRGVSFRYGDGPRLTPEQQDAAWRAFCTADLAETAETVAVDATRGYWGNVRLAIPCVALLRDLFGNPFRPAPPLPPQALQWSDGTVKRLAESAYEQRALPAGTLDNARLAVLADALEEAGCISADLLNHLRGPGPHVRGCWAVDLLLGKG